MEARLQTGGREETSRKGWQSLFKAGETKGKLKGRVGEQCKGTVLASLPLGEACTALCVCVVHVCQSL